MADPLLYLRIHQLAHRFSASSVFTSSERIEYALEILKTMDAHRVLHPSYPQILLFLKEVSPTNNEAAVLLNKYGLEWAAVVKDREIASQLESGEGIAEDQDKEHAFASFLPKFRLLFVLADFRDLFYHVNRLSLAVEFRIHCTDHEQLIANRYFELIFYQLVAIVYGQLWFSEYSILGEAPSSSASSSNAKSWQQLENNAKNYHLKAQFLMKSIKDKRQELVDGVNGELDFYYLIRWLCALAKFKENKFNDFVQEFHLLEDHMSALDVLGLSKETVLMYQLATVATENFCDLVSRDSESLMELYSGTTPVETEMFLYLCKLLDADFAGAKQVYDSNLTLLLDAHIGYAIPQKLKGTFWQFLNVTVDLKVFLLIMSCALLIPREKLLDKMGYKGALDVVKDNVTAGILILIAVLSLGKANVTFNPTEDAFSREPLSENEKLRQLTDEIDELDHSIAADAAAQLVKTRLVEKLFNAV